jgi:hypothetical protein
MPKLFDTLVAAVALCTLSAGTAFAGSLDGPEQEMHQNASGGAVRRTLEITRATGQTAMKTLALPADFSRWVDQQRSHHVIVGVTLVH